MVSQNNFSRFADDLVHKNEAADFNDTDITNFTQKGNYRNISFTIFRTVIGAL